jgi:hypothetical protein
MNGHVVSIALRPLSTRRGAWMKLTRWIPDHLRVARVRNDELVILA